MSWIGLNVKNLIRISEWFHWLPVVLMKIRVQSPDTQRSRNLIFFPCNTVVKNKWIKSFKFFKTVLIFKHVCESAGIPIHLLHHYSLLNHWIIIYDYMETRVHNDLARQYFNLPIYKTRIVYLTDYAFVNNNE